MHINLDCTIGPRVEKFESLCSTIQIDGDMNDCIVQHMRAMAKTKKDFA